MFWCERRVVFKMKAKQEYCAFEQVLLNETATLSKEGLHSGRMIMSEPVTPNHIPKRCESLACQASWHTEATELEVSSSVIIAHHCHVLTKGLIDSCHVG